MRVAVLTTGRQDWGILRSVCVALRDDPDFDLRLLLGGMHCSDRFGRTETLVRADGFSPSETLAWIDDGGGDDGDATAAHQSARALSAVADALRRQAPGCLLVVGDRIAAMGEDPATIHVMGSPALDNLQRTDLATRAELEELLGMKLAAPVVVVT